MKTESQPPTYHIHDVLNALHVSPEPRSKDDLKLFMTERFGPTAQFFSCSCRDMTIEQAIDFMLTRGKLNEVVASKYSTEGAKTCHH